MNKKAIEAIANEVRTHYRHLHAHPELSGEELETAKYIQSILKDMGIEVVPCSNGGFHGDIKGEKEGRTVALRADMDALPVKEATGLAFASKTEGLMHACGHDMHMAILLGTATYFTRHRDFAGTVRLIFQPNEEKDGGAEVMVAEGVMDGVDNVMGLHVSPYLDLGTVGVRPGFMYAGVEDFKFTITGRGGHAAHPDACIDPIVCGGHIIVALQTIVARRFSPLTPAVVTIGSVHGGNKHNIIPDTMTLEGTIRADTMDNMNILRTRLRDIATTTAAAHDCRCDMEVIKGYIPLINDPEATEIVRQAAVEAFGPDSVVTLPRPTMSAEDFAYYLQKAPGSFINLGAKKPGDKRHALHTAEFYPEEEAITYGICAEVASALAFLAQ